jgi:hypothetical protein
MRIPIFILFAVACIGAWALVLCAAQAMFTGEFRPIPLVIALAVMGWFIFEVKNPVEK